MISLVERKLLTDILIALVSIDEHLEFRRLVLEYKSNKTKRRAVEREVEIAGKALSQLLKIEPKMKVSYVKEILDLHKKLTQTPDHVDDMAVWDLVVNHLPTLKKEVESLLS
jgi:uncharacterized protein with HEPN domain